MKKVVFTIKEDICEKNGKDVNATELLQIMTHYGSVEEYDLAVSKDKVEYQAIVDNLTKQLAMIKEQELTVDEMDLVKSYRTLKSKVEAQHLAIEEECRATITKLEDTLAQFKHKIIAVVGE